MWRTGTMQRELVESSDYTIQLNRLGDLRRLDDALTGVCWALSTNPEVYEVVRGFKDVRLAKTDPLGGLPALRIWFRIEPDGYRVTLLYIEAVPDGE
jgi:hypothetical protein